MTVFAIVFLVALGVMSFFLSDSATGQGFLGVDGFVRIFGLEQPKRTIPPLNTPLLPKPVCGNEVVEFREQCDGTNLNGKTCQTQGFASGTLSCTRASMRGGGCLFDTSQCSSVPVELRADFKVYELINVDSEGNEEWREIDLENEEIELGLRVKFDASQSPQAVNFRWRKDGFLISIQPTLILSFDDAGNTHEFKLTVYNQGATQTATTTRTVRVKRSTEFSEKVVIPPSNVAASSIAFDFDSMVVWVSRTNGDLVVVDGGALEIMDSYALSDYARSTAYSNGLIYRALGTYGFRVYKVESFGESFQVEELGFYNSNPELDFQSAQEVESFGEFSLLAAGPAGLKLFHASESGGLQLVDAYQLPFRADLVEWSGSRAVVYAGSLHVFDVELVNSNPLQSQIHWRGSIDLPLPVVDISLDETGELAAVLGGVKLIMLDLSDQKKPVIVGELDLFEETRRNFHSVVFAGRDLFLGGGSGGLQILEIARLDISNPFQPYLMYRVPRPAGTGPSGSVRDPILFDEVIYWRSGSHDIFKISFDKLE